MRLSILPSTLSGQIQIPPSKSQTLRALLFALLAKGESVIQNPLASPDTDAMCSALELLGASIEKTPHCLRILGTAGQLKPAQDVIFCGNSGQVLRFVGALAALIPSYTILTGDASIRTQRPVLPLLKGLSDLGAFAASASGLGTAPIIVRGPLVGSVARFSGEDSQPVSGLLIAGSFAPHPITLHVENPGETPWIDLTLSWLKRFGIPYEREGYTTYRLQGNASIEGFHFDVPADFSSLLYPLAAAIITGSQLRLGPLDRTDPQGDKEVIGLLQEWGAQIELEGKTLVVKKGSSLQGGPVDINRFIDALPILAVLGCFAKTPTHIYNGKIARKKESDRIATIAMELKKMGAVMEEREDGLIVFPSLLCGARVSAHRDHRIALSLAVAALGAKGETEIDGVEVIAKSYPTFIEDMKKIGAKLQVLP